MFQSKNILITGGSKGLGRALLEHFLNEGANVAIVARNQDDVLKVATETGALGIVGDISSKEQIHALAAEVHSRLGSVDILVNNASYLGQTPLRLLLDTECEDFQAVLETNLIGPLRLIKLIAPSMIAKGSGTIINISSNAAVNAYPNWGAYSVSKAALDHMTAILNVELNHLGIESLAIDPGDMHTDLHLQAIPDADTQQLKRPEESARQILEILKKKPQERRVSL